MSRDRSYIESDKDILEGFINAFKDIGFIIDREGRFLEAFYSSETEQLLYRDKSELLDKKLEDIFTEEKTQKFLSTIQESIDKDGLETLEYKLDVKDGSRWFEARIHPLPQNRGTPQVIWISRDITQQKQYEKELQEKTDQLDILNRIIRHDIRNDMNVIDLYLENTLKKHKDKIPEEVLEDLEKVRDRSSHVTELTKISRDIAETITKDKQKTTNIGLEEILKEQIEDIKTSYPETKIDVKTDIPDIDVLADEMLSSVFRNILFNAIQHSDKQTPKIEICTKQDKESVTVSFSDNGPGIPDDLKETVFGKGEKSMDSTGTGIGLYLVDTLIKNYSGDVWIEDNKPEGCVFKIKLKKPPV